MKGARKHRDLIAALEAALDGMALKNGRPDEQLQRASRSMIALTLVGDGPQVFELKKLAAALHLSDASMREYVFRFRLHLSTSHPELLASLSEAYRGYPLGRLIITTGKNRNEPMSSLPGAMVDASVIDSLEAAMPAMLPNETHRVYARSLIRQALSFEKGAQIPHEDYNVKTKFQMTGSYNHFVDTLRKTFSDAEPELKSALGAKYQGTAIHELLCGTEPWVGPGCYDRGHAETIRAARRYQHRGNGNDR